MGSVLIKFTIVILVVFTVQQSSAATGSKDYSYRGAVPSNDTFPPVPTYTGNPANDTIIKGTVKDMPDDVIIRSNLSSILLDVDSSYNCTLDYDPFIPGETRSTKWYVRQDYIRKPSFAKISFTDRAGNDTMLRFYFEAKDVRPKIAANGPLTFCCCDPLKLDAGEGYKSYLWSTGDTTRVINPKMPKATRDAILDVWVDVVGMRGTAFRSDTVRLRRVWVPENYTLTRRGDTLFADSVPQAAAFMWSRNGQGINFFQNYCVITENGVYSVTVIDTLTCVFQSLAFSVMDIVQASVDDETEVLQYNSQSHQLLIKNIEDITTITVFNSTGERVSMFNYLMQKKESVVDLGSYPCGLYLIRIEGSHGVISKAVLR